MTIRKGIDPGDVLWKIKEQRETRRTVMNEDGSHRYETHTFDVHYAIVLTTRRARSQGHVVDETLKPFFEQIRIRLIPQRVWTGNGGPERFEYVAVGTAKHRISEEAYRNTPINEVAARYYQNVRNNNLVPFLEKYEEPYSDSLIEDMRAYLEDDESPVVEWPEEPTMHPLNETLNRYNRLSSW